VPKDEKMRNLLAKATKDKGFREEFLKDPIRVGRKHGVSFNKTQLKNIKETAVFIDSTHDIVIGQPEPIYPLYPTLVRWKIDEIITTIRFRDPRIFYPPPWHYMMDRGRRRY
jgi:hypothetical protein